MPFEEETIVTERPSTVRQTIMPSGSTGVIGGIVVALLLVVLIVALVAWFFGVFEGGQPVTVDLPSVTVTP